MIFRCSRSVTPNTDIARLMFDANLITLGKHNRMRAYDNILYVSVRPDVNKQDSMYRD